MALYGLLVMLGAVLLGLRWQVDRHDAEHRHDAELVALAARQGMWSQHIARLGALQQAVPVDPQPAAQALREAIDTAQAQALRLTERVDQQSRGSAAAAGSLRPVLQDWQEAPDRLTYRAEGVRRSLLEQEDPEFLRAAVVALQMEADPVLAAGQRLAQRSADEAFERITGYSVRSDRPRPGAPAAGGRCRPAGGAAHPRGAAGWFRRAGGFANAQSSRPRVLAGPAATA